MNNVVEAFLDKARPFVRATIKRRWMVLWIASAVALASGFAISFVSDRYEAGARVYVDTQTVLKPLMSGLTFQPDIDQQVHMLARTLISRPNIERLVQTPGLGMDSSDAVMRQDTVTKLMKEIKVNATPAGNLYDIVYRGSSPVQAQRLVAATVDMFVHAGVGAKEQDSREAGRFIQDQIGSYELKLTAAENRLKDFKLRHFGVSGLSNQDYFTRMSSLSDEVNKLRIALNGAEQTRDSYQHELAGEGRQLPPELARQAATGPVGEIETRLDAQSKQLDELLRRYTEQHPDVISARRVIAELQAELAQRKEAEQRMLQRLGMSAQATNPVYQKLRIALADAEAQVAALRSQLATQQSRLDEVRALAGRAPEVEAELAQLNRDYDVIRKNYDVMVARRESASLGVKLDESSQLTEFRVVEPPRVSWSPVFPGRLHLALIAIVVSLAAGVGAASVAELVRPSVDESAGLSALSRRPVLGALSVLLSPADRHRQRKNLMRFAIAVAFFVAFQATWLAWLVAKPPVQFQ